jgi:uncharacterized protein YndB with AHSA1/START domain
MKTESKRPAARAITDGDTILSTLEVAAPPEAVFRALTTEEIERWWGSAETYRLTAWKADLRVGGRWQVTVRGADGNPVPVGGKFLEIDAPRKLVYTREYDRDHPTMGGAVTTITYHLDAVESGTRVTVRHDGFAGRKEPALEHADGWESVLGWLEAYVRSAPQQKGATKIFLNASRK